MFTCYDWYTVTHKGWYINDDMKFSVLDRLLNDVGGKNIETNKYFLKLQLKVNSSPKNLENMYTFS